jgi:hypothetical protein
LKAAVRAIEEAAAAMLVNRDLDRGRLRFNLHYAYGLDITLHIPQRFLVTGLGHLG